MTQRPNFLKRLLFVGLGVLAIGIFTAYQNPNMQIYLLANTWC